MFYCRARCGGSRPAFEAAGNSFPLPNPTRYGRHTHSSFKQTKAAHNDQPCHYGRLIWSGPGHCGFIFFYAHIDVCHSLNMHYKHVCTSVSIQTNGDSLGQRACGTACPLIAIYILAESLISNSPYYLSPTIPHLTSLSDACVNVRVCQCHSGLDGPSTALIFLHDRFIIIISIINVYSVTVSVLESQILYDIVYI